MSWDAGNVHDSVAFFHLNDCINDLYDNKIEIYVADSGYTTPGIYHTVIKEEKQLIVPYKRSGKQKGNV